jgi:hypothetical protein
MYYLKTSSRRVSEVMTALAEGVDESAAQRIFHHDRRTIARPAPGFWGWLKRCGSHAQRLHDLFFRHLHCAHLQLDELVTTLRGGFERVWIWAVIDAQTKIVPVIHVGRRTVIDAHVFVHQLKLRLRSDRVPAFSSDGLRAYYSALSVHFGFWRDPDPGRRGRRTPTWVVDPRLLFGQLHTVRDRRRLKTLYTRIRCGSRRRKWPTGGHGDARSWPSASPVRSRPPSSNA